MLSGANIKGFTDLFHSALLRKNMPCLSAMLDLKDGKDPYFVAKLGLMLLQELLVKLPEASEFGIKLYIKQLQTNFRTQITINMMLCALMKGTILKCMSEDCVIVII